MKFSQATCRPLLNSTLLLTCALVVACGGASNTATATSAPAPADPAPPAAGAPPAAAPVAPPVAPPVPPPVEVVPPVDTTPPVPTSPTLADGSLAWSHPANWGGTLPPAGAEVVIPAGKTITLDTSPPALAGLRVEGTLRFARRDLALTAGYIDVTGAIEVGTAVAPFTHKAVITLSGAIKAPNDGVSRGLNVRGGRLELYGQSPSPAWTKLNDHAAAGATALTLKDNVNWKAGDTIAVAPTDYYGVAETERLAVASASGNRVTLASGLAKYRWGKLQYVTNSGMSLTPDPTYVPPALPAPTELDQRAAVGNLTRNIVIQGVDDTAWRNEGFGAHVMVMGLASKITIDGVEFRRAGQAGVMARYPIHWHMLSYASDGQLMGDAVGHVIRNSSIWNSANRCVVVHGTNGVQVLNNICQDIKGHAFFLEDAVERRNVFDGNLALMTRSPVAAKLLQVHEGPNVFQAGPSGFWLTNPDNTVRNNLAGDSHGNGFWMAFPRKPLGLSASVPILPDRTPHGVFENNTGHTARGPGVLLELVPTDAAGNVTPNKYIPTVNGAEDTYSNRVRFTIKGVVSYKNLQGAYRNRVSAPDYLEWVTADNAGTYFAGAGDDGVISRGLMVGTSLNNLTPYPNVWPYEHPSAFATYHSTFSIRQNTLVNFPFVEGKSSGAFKTDDYYLIGVDKGPARNVGNRLMATHPGYRTPPPHMDGQPLANRHWTLAGALWDPHGYWGRQLNFWVYDVPFLTAGATCQQVEPAGKNGASCDGQYYGLGWFKTDFDTNQYQFTSAIEATRIDSAGNAIGKWSVQDGANSTQLGWMRHFAARQGGSYILRFPGKPAARFFAMDVTNAFRDSDSFMFAVQFDGSVNATGYALARDSNREDPRTSPSFWASQPNIRWFQPANSLAEVAASDGNRLWQDRANNLVWIKFKGGLPFTSALALTSNSDADLYRTYGVVIY